MPAFIPKAGSCSSSPLTPRLCGARETARSAEGPPYECPPKYRPPTGGRPSPSAPGVATASSSSARRTSCSRRDSFPGEKVSSEPSESRVEDAVPSVCSTHATTAPCEAIARIM
eukprot:1514618-Prymnesium_polylepis.1